MSGVGGSNVRRRRALGQISHTTIRKSDPHFIDLSCRTGEITIKVVCAMCMWRICVAFQTSRMEGKQEAKAKAEKKKTTLRNSLRIVPVP